MENNQARSALISLKAAMEARDRVAINSICRRLVLQDAPLGNQWRSIIELLQHNGEHLLAIEAANRWSRQTGEHDRTKFHLATVLARAGRVSAAEAIACDLDPNALDLAAYHFLRGTLAINSGRAEDAQAHLRKALRANPQAGQAWLALAMNGQIALEDATAIKAASSVMAKAAPIERSAWFYALGKVESECRGYDAAFFAFTEGAALMRVQQSYQPERDALAGESIRSQWTADVLANVITRSGRTSSLRPMFVCGLPRSGTTLVEQILASHSGVAGGAELGVFHLLEQDIGGRSVDALIAYEARGGTLDALRRLYLHLVEQRFPGEGRVVDKTLNASRYLGLLAALFPSAPIVWVRRAPVDCAWSAFRTWFLKGASWSWSLKDIAAHFRVEDALFEHWCNILPGRIHVIQYESLVRHPKAEIIRLMDYCGLDIEADQLLPHRTRRSVITASAAQVREPINTSAIGNASPYARHMEPFIGAYID